VRELLFLVLVLACPLMMILMMRGHGHADHAHGTGHAHARNELERWPESESTAQLRRQRDALDRLIEERETVTPAGGAGFECDGDRSPSG
jgi:Protein of unknown function (DUF2933)